MYSCEDCNKYDSNGLYECSYCRSNICEYCYVDEKYLLCKSCNEKFRKKEINEKDMYSWLITCEKCGNMWDGNAQCNCWEYDFSLTFESDNEGGSDDENMTDNEDE
jgi:hypothetical protein